MAIRHFKDPNFSMYIYDDDSEHGGEHAAVLSFHMKTAKSSSGTKSAIASSA